jgi:catalase
MRNFQRDGVKRQNVPTGRVAYEPNTLDSAGPRESAERGYVTYAEQESGEKQRIRSETFADHYSQARLFFRSMSEPEQRHIISAFAFELGKVETLAIRKRILGHLMISTRPWDRRWKRPWAWSEKPNGSRRRAIRSISTSRRP